MAFYGGGYSGTGIGLGLEFGVGYLLRFGEDGERDITADFTGVQ